MPLRRWTRPSASWTCPASSSWRARVRAGTHAGAMSPRIPWRFSRPRPTAPMCLPPPDGSWPACPPRRWPTPTPRGSPAAWWDTSPTISGGASRRCRRPRPRTRSCRCSAWHSTTGSSPGIGGRAGRGSPAGHWTSESRGWIAGSRRCASGSVPAGQACRSWATSRPRPSSSDPAWAGRPSKPAWRWFGPRLRGARSTRPTSRGGWRQPSGVTRGHCSAACEPATQACSPRTSTWAPARSRGRGGPSCPHRRSRSCPSPRTVSSPRIRSRAPGRAAATGMRIGHWRASSWRPARTGPRT
ncbi:MAG: hypothetical protein HW391_1921 [Chloroflexi bacterium]|nr:hypothetical protein [Chloroflexota bacterium]